ncbi:MAG: sodium/proton-translocating pyrophosphatase [Chloroflexaceae bacterium]|nr:sodium/proton-translocating pyrophosphatase [Chloroflexaceae bacterium]
MEGFTPIEANLIWAVLLIALISIGYGFWLWRQVQHKAADEIAAAGATLVSGTQVYLAAGRGMLAVAVLGGAVLMAASALLAAPGAAAVQQFGSTAEAQTWVAIGRAGALLIGAGSVLLIAWLGLGASAQANMALIPAARKGYPQALQVAYRPGSSSGLLTAGLGLLVSTAIVLVYGAVSVDILLSFALGGVLVAIWLAVSSGIGASAADTALFPTDEPGVSGSAGLQHPVTVAGLVQRSASRVAAVAADLFGTMEIALVAALIPGLMLADIASGATGDGLYAFSFVLFPLVLRAIGIVATIIGTLLIRTDERKRNARAAINRGLYIGAALALVAALGISYIIVRRPDAAVFDWRPFCAVFTGVVLALLAIKISEYFTSSSAQPVKLVSRFSAHGAPPAS